MFSIYGSAVIHANYDLKLINSKFKLVSLTLVSLIRVKGDIRNVYLWNLQTRRIAKRIIGSTNAMDAITLALR